MRPSLLQILDISGIVINNKFQIQQNWIQSELWRDEESEAIYSSTSFCTEVISPSFHSFVFFLTLVSETAKHAS